MSKQVIRRSVTIEDINHAFICKVRGKAISSLHDVDYTTTLNAMLKFAREKGFTEDNI